MYLSFCDCPQAPASPYEILGLPKDAPLDNIKEAYRKLSLIWHPDKNSPADKAKCEAMFKKISNAYKELRYAFDAGRAVVHVVQ